MKNSDNVRWFERAYDVLRAELLPEAPPEVTLTVGLIANKKAVGLCSYDCIRAHDRGFGAENLVTLHPIQGQDIVTMLATLAHEMIHCATEPHVKHGREFVAFAKKIGLMKPWTATTPDLPLQHKLRGYALDLERELGYMPALYYEPKPPLPRKPSAVKKFKCGCNVPRTLALSQKQIEKGAILCGVCEAPFREMTDGGDRIIVLAGEVVTGA